MIDEARARDPGELERARRDFFERTGAFDAGDRCFEERIQLFFDWYLCSWPGALLPPALRLARATDDPKTRAVAEACLTATRGLFRVLGVSERRVHLEEQLGGARFRVEPQRAEPFQDGELFDGHLLWAFGGPRLLPGRVFHPPSTHEALGALVAEARTRLARADLLDGLLRARMRLERFTSIHPRHVYRLDALELRPILSAPWARRPEVAAAGPIEGARRRTGPPAEPAAPRSEDP